MALRVADIRRLAREAGLVEVQFCERNRVIAFRKPPGGVLLDVPKGDPHGSEESIRAQRGEGARINVWYTTGTVGTYLEHPKAGKSQLFRRNVNLSLLEKIFKYPRVHTRRGYKLARNRPDGHLTNDDASICAVSSESAESSSTIPGEDSRDINEENAARASLAALTRELEQLDLERAVLARQIEASRAIIDRCEGERSSTSASLDMEKAGVDLVGKRVVLSGCFGALGREEYEKVLRRHGMLIRRQISSKTDFLVLGGVYSPEHGPQQGPYPTLFDPAKGTKAKKAGELGVRIVCRAEMNTLVNGRQRSGLGAARCNVCQAPATQRCSGCFAVYYCCAEHQKVDRPAHRDFCREAAADSDDECDLSVCMGEDDSIDDAVVVVEIGPNDRDAEDSHRFPYGARYKNHVFPTRAAALGFIREAFGDARLPSAGPPLVPLTNMPILHEILLFESAELYVDPVLHITDKKASDMRDSMTSESRVEWAVRGVGSEDLNSSLIFGLPLDCSFSRFHDVKGTAFFMGRAHTGAWATGSVIRGVQLFLYDVILKWEEVHEAYGTPYEMDSKRYAALSELCVAHMGSVLAEWGDLYMERRWTPGCRLKDQNERTRRATTQGVYDYDPSTTDGGVVDSVDHRRGAAASTWDASDVAGGGAGGGTSGGEVGGDSLDRGAQELAEFIKANPFPPKKVMEEHMTRCFQLPAEALKRLDFEIMREMYETMHLVTRCGLALKKVSNRFYDASQKREARLARFRRIGMRLNYVGGAGWMQDHLYGVHDYIRDVSKGSLSGAAFDVVQDYVTLANYAWDGIGTWEA